MAETGRGYPTKRLENYKWGNLCLHSCGHEAQNCGILVETGRGVPYEKNRKILSGGTCAHEGELVAMKAKIVEFWLKPVGGALTKKAGKLLVEELVAMKAKIVDFWLKPVGGTLRKRLENYKWGNLCP